MKKLSGSKWGINLSTVNCPSCKTKQPAIRIPKNFKQFLWGGHICSSCNAEMDKFGNVI